MKHKNTQPLYIFNRENPQNSEPQNGPRSGLDYIALIFLVTRSKEVPQKMNEREEGFGERKYFSDFCHLVKCKEKVTINSIKPSMYMNRLIEY